MESNGTNDAKDFDNLQTWPKSQLSNRILTDLHQWIHLENIINQAKAFVQQNAAGESGSTASSSTAQNATVTGDQTRMQDATQIICALTKELELACERQKPSKADVRAPPLFKKFTVDNTASPLSRRLRINSMQNSTANMGVIREDPHFESMIICDTTQRNSNAADTNGDRFSIKSTSDSSIVVPAQKQTKKESTAAQQDALELGASRDFGIREFPTILDIDNSEMPGESVKDPAFLRAIPHILLVSFAVAYLVGGAFLFQVIDEAIAAKPFRLVLLYVFQTCTSIGWGDVIATNRWSQMLCVVYTIFGVPIIFSLFANLGRLMTEFYCIDWLFLTSVVRQRNFQTVEVRRRFPIKATVNLLFVHQCIGVIIYGSLLKDFTVVQVIYFSITSMATTGFGDFHPNPKNMAETITVIVYISSGIIILSALLLSIGYYFQRIIYVVIPNYIHYYYTKHRESLQQNKDNS